MATGLNKQVDGKAYADLIAIRLKNLRRSHDIGMKELQSRIIKESGIEIAVSTLYAYERPAQAGDESNPKTGLRLPIKLIPVIAKIYGYETASGWLPKKI